MPTPAISSPITVAELLERYDVFLLDGHGVLINSAGPLPGAASFLRGIKDRGKQYLLLSNDASRSPAAIVDRYRRAGLELDLDRVLSSGLLLRDYFASEGLRGRRCIVLGTHDSADYV
ncbi:MAG: haloacid dehalogenase, partial [Candidatus Binatia bacterium]